MRPSDDLLDNASPDGTAIHDPLSPATWLSPSTWIVGSAIALYSFALALLCIHSKLFWMDELLEYYSDTKLSLRGVLFGQLHYPFSLEPPAFHLLEHLLDGIAPSHPEFSARVLSALCLPITECCAFWATLRLTGRQCPALFAMALPFLLATFNYASEARVYSLLTALFAIAIVSYQAAIQPGANRRTLPLLGLCLALSAATLVHYYGLFLAFPFLCGEAVRWAQRRRFDRPVLAVLAISLSVFVFNLPFLNALHEIQAHYYDAGETAWRMIPLSYAWFFAPDGVYFLAATHLGWQILIVGASCLTVLLFLAFFRKWSRISDPHVAPMYAVLAGGCLLPLVNLTVAHCFTHAYVPRYNLPAAVAISIAAAAMLASWFRRRWCFALALLVLGLIGSYFAVRTVQKQTLKQRLSLANRSINPALAGALASVSDRHIYFQAVAEFGTLYFYADPALKSRMVLLESEDKELFWLHRNPSSIFARNMGSTTALPVMQFQCLQAQAGPHILVVFHDRAEEWIDREIESGAMTAQPLGEALSGTIYRVEFPALRIGSEGQTTDACIRGLKRIQP
jgi:hypothetical protein